MATIQSNKLTVKKDGVEQKVNIYSSAVEATPTGGSYLQVTNNGVTGYIGLHTSSTEHYPTPLTVKRNGTTYYIQTQVVFALTKSIGSNTWVKFQYDNASGAEIASGTKVPYGTVVYLTFGNNSHYQGTTCKVGSTSVSSGSTFTVTGDTTVTTTAAALDSHKVTFSNATGATLTVKLTNVSGTNVTNNGSYTHGTVVYVAVSAANTTEYTYSGLWIKVNGTAVTSGSTFTLTADTTITCGANTSTRNNYTVTLSQGTGSTLTAKKTNASGDAITSGSSLPYGTVIYVTGSANTGYQSLVLKQGSTSITAGSTFTLTGNVTISSTATFISKNITVPAVSTGIASYTIKQTVNSYGSASKYTGGTSTNTTGTQLTSGTATGALTTQAVIAAAPYNSTNLVTWTATAGYHLSKKTQSETVANSTASTFTNPTATAYKLNIPAVTTGIASYKITITYTGNGTITPGYASGTASSAKTAATENLLIPATATVKIDYTPTDGYALSKTSDTISNIDANTSITLPTASVITKTITVPAVTTGIASYTIKITKGTLGTMPSGYTSGTATSAITGETKVIGVPYGATFLVTWTPSPGYTLSKKTQSETVANATASTFTNPTATGYAVSIPAVTTGIKSYSVTITYSNANGLITSGYASGTAKTGITGVTNITVPSGATVKVDWIADTGYTLTKTTDSVTNIAAAKTFAAPTANVSTFTVTIPAKGTNIASVKATITKGTLGTMPSGWTDKTQKDLSSATGNTTATVPYGSKVEVVWTAAAGYDLDNNSETVTSLTAAKTFTNPTATGYAVSVPAVTTGIASYKVTITYSGKGTITSGYVSGTAKTDITGVTNITVPKTATVKVDWVATTGYSLSKTTESATNLAAAKSFTVPTATVISKTITVPAVVTGIAGYTIKITKGTLGTMPSGYTSGTASGAKTEQTPVSGVPYGATFLATWSPSTGYGLSKTTQSETVTNATASTFTNPTVGVIYQSVTIPLPANVASFKLTLTKGTLGTLPSGYTSGTQNTTAFTSATTVKIPYGTKIDIDWTPATGYTKPSGSSYTHLTGTYTWTSGEAIAAAKTLNSADGIPTLGVTNYTVTVPAVTTGIAKYAVTITKGTLGTMPSGWTSGTAKTDITDATNVSVPYGSTVKVDWTETTGYSLSKTTETASNIAAAKNFANPTASIITRKFTVPAFSTASYDVTVTKGTLGTMPATYSKNGTATNFTSGTKISGQTVKSEFTSLPYGTTYAITWNRRTGYYLSKTSDSGTLTTADVTLTAPTETLYKHNVTIPAVSGNVASYTIKVKLNTTYQSTMPSCTVGGTAVTLTNDTATGAQTGAATITSVPYGATVTVVWTAKTGNTFNSNQTTITTTSTSTHTVNESTTAYAFAQPATYTSKYTLTLAGSYANKNIRLTNASGTAISATGTYDYGTVIYVNGSLPTNTAQYTYSNLVCKVGGSTVTAGSTFTLTGNTTVDISCTRTVNKYTVTLTGNATKGVRLTNASGALISSGSSYDYGTVIYVNGSLPTNTAQYTYSALTLKVGGTTVTAGSTHTLTANVTIDVSCTATTNQYTVTLTGNATKNVRLTNASGTAVVSGQKYNYGTVIYINGTKLADTTSIQYNDLALKWGSETVTAGTTKTLTGDITIDISSSIKNYYVTLSGSYATKNIRLTNASGTQVTASGWYAPNTKFYINGSLPSNTAQYSYSSLVCKWAGNSVTAGSVQTLTAATTIDISCTRTVNKYTITLGSHPNCSVSLASSGLTTVTNGNLTNVPYGATVTVTVNEDSGYQIDSVKKDGTDL